MRILRTQTSYNPIVTNSGEKATFWTDVSDAKYENVIQGDFKGPTSLGKMGQYDLTVTNRAISSSGDIIVAAGTLRFSANSSWLNAAEVTVSNATATSAAVLEINQKDTFSKKAVVRLGNGGKIRVGGAETEGTTFMQKVAELHINGEKMAPGRYSADGHDSTVKCDSLEGPGVLCVRGGGFTMFVR